MKVIFNYVLLFFLVKSSFSQTSGSFDGSFATNGAFLGKINYYGKSVLFQTGGKIIVAGSKMSNADAFIMRMGASGIVDNTFGASGYTKVVILADETGIEEACQTASGNILVVGSTNFNYSPRGYVASYTSNGAVDNSFGSSGYVLFGPSGAKINSIELQPDGKIVLCGKSTMEKAMVIRLDSNGAYDNSFGTAGIAYVNSSSSNEWVDLLDVKIQSDGKIVLAGKKYSKSGYTPFHSKSCVVRLNANGTFDSTFGLAGEVLINASNGSLDEANAVNILADGKYILTGYSYDGNDHDFMIFKLKVGGERDSTFGISGMKIYDLLGKNLTEASYSSLVQPDGKIVLGGITATGDTVYYTMLRVDKFGNKDIGFGNNSGFQKNIIQSKNNNAASDIVMAPDGKLLMTGYSRTCANGICQAMYMSVVRYNNDPAMAIEETKREEVTMNIFPNPVSEGGKFGVYLNVKNNGILSVNIYSSVGQLINSPIVNKIVYQGSFYTDITLPDNIAKGLYMLEVLYNERKKVQSFIIQ